MSKKKSSDNFEDKLARLEEITTSLENSEIGLEDSIQLFEEGVKLSKECLSVLEKAELKVTTLKNVLNKINNLEED
jgi:exodeoxyribonuclease VII small subunit